MTLVDRLRAAVRASPPIPGLIEGDSIVDHDIPPVPAAVLIAIIERPEPAVILTRRTEHVRRHPGQIAFPGGRIDPADADAVAAALREAEEEIGLPRSGVNVLGIIDPYRTVTGFDVTPVVGLVRVDLPLVAAPDEVAAIFEAPLAYLVDPRHQIVRSMLWEGRERQHYEIEWKGHRIWGATAAMIVNLSRRMALPA